MKILAHTEPGVVMMRLMRRNRGVIAVVAAVAVTLAACNDDSPRPSRAAPRPSQSATDARRDGVIPELAEASLHARSDRLAGVDTRDGRWVISRPSKALQDASIKDGCRLGPEGGENGTEAICTIEYGEILLVRGGEIMRAYPMPEVPPTWIYAADDAIFGGRIGDGCLPHSTLFRIDRATFALELIVFPQTEDLPALLPSWRVATELEEPLFNKLVDTPNGIPVTAEFGPFRVDIDGVARLFAEAKAASPQAVGSGSC